MGYEVFDGLCKKKGVTPYKVSKDTGVSTSTLSSWKTGRYEPKDDKLRKLADYFGVSTHYLRTGSELKQIVIKRPNYENIVKASFDNEEDYYLYKESQAISQEIYGDNELHALFKAARGSRPEDLKMARDLLERLKETNPDG